MLYFAGTQALPQQGMCDLWVWEGRDSVSGAPEFGDLRSKGVVQAGLIGVRDNRDAQDHWGDVRRPAFRSGQERCPGSPGPQTVVFTMFTSNPKSAKPETMSWKAFSASHSVVQVPPVHAYARDLARRHRVDGQRE